MRNERPLTRHKANEAMGIRMNTEDSHPQLSAFSQDILKIEITGPQTRLAVTQAASRV